MNIIRQFLSSLPRLTAIALSLSGPNDRNELEVALETQPHVRLLYWDQVPDDQEDLEMLARFANLRVFGMRSLVKEEVEEKMVQLLQSAFARRLSHLHAVSLWIRAYPDHELTDRLRQQVCQLRTQHSLKQLSHLPGYMWDVYAEQLDRLKVLE